MVDNPFPISFPIFSIPFNPQNLISLILFWLLCRSFCWHCEMWPLFLGVHSFIQTIIFDNKKRKKSAAGAEGVKYMVKSTVNVGVVSAGISDNSLCSLQRSRHIHKQGIKMLKWGACEMGAAIKGNSCSSKGPRFHSQH